MKKIWFFLSLRRGILPVCLLYSFSNPSPISALLRHFVTLSLNKTKNSRFSLTTPFFKILTAGLKHALTTDDADSSLTKDELKE